MLVALVVGTLIVSTLFALYLVGEATMNRGFEMADIQQERSAAPVGTAQASLRLERSQNARNELGRPEGLEPDVGAA